MLNVDDVDVKSDRIRERREEAEINSLFGAPSREFGLASIPRWCPTLVV